MSVIICRMLSSPTHFNINLIRVSSRRVEARPVHIHPHHKLMSVTRKTGHSCGVLKGSSNLYQTATWVRYWANVRTRAGIWSLPVVDAEVTDVAGAVVAVHNVPGEGDVGAVPTGHLEVADMIVLGSCIATWSKEIRAWIVYNDNPSIFFSIYCYWLCTCKWSKKQ